MPLLELGLYRCMLALLIIGSGSHLINAAIIRLSNKYKSISMIEKNKNKKTNHQYWIFSGYNYSVLDMVLPKYGDIFVYHHEHDPIVHLL